MSEDPIRKYSTLCEEFEVAYKRIRELGDITQEVAQHLNYKPHIFIISNVSVGFPIELGLSREVFTLDGNRWPSAKDIAEAIVALQEKRKKVKDAWRSLSATDKKLVSQLDTQD